MRKYDSIVKGDKTKYNKLEINLLFFIMQKLTLTLPASFNLPDCFKEATPDRSALILRMGADAFNSGVHAVASMSHDDIRCEDYEKRLKDAAESIRKSEMEITILREMSKRDKEEETRRLDENINRLLRIKDGEIRLLNDTLINKEKDMVRQREELRAKETEFNTAVEKIVNDRLQYERERHQIDVKETLEKNMKMIEDINRNLLSKCSVDKGKIGEKIFETLAKETFVLFNKFEICDNTKRAHEGDFHLKFEEFTVLADAKYYKSSVDSTQRKKIINDLRGNAHIPFAWLISLDTRVDCYDKCSFMFEWISDTQAVVYVNSLLDSPVEKQRDLLLTIYFECLAHYKRIQASELGATELVNLRQLRYDLMDYQRVELTRKLAEIKKTMNILGNLHDSIKNDLAKLCSNDTTLVHGENDEKIIKWWNENAVREEGSETTSTTFWNKFKADNPTLKDVIGPKMFRDIIQNILACSDYVKPKTAGGAMTILNYGFQATDKGTSPTLKISLNTSL